MSDTIALITIIKSDEDACFFIEHVLPSVAQYLSAQSMLQYCTWLFHTDADHHECIRIAIGKWLPDIQYQLIERDGIKLSIGSNYHQYWMTLAQYALDAYSHIFIIRPDHYYQAGLLERMPLFLESKQVYMLLRVIPFISNAYPAWDDDWGAQYFSSLGQSMNVPSQLMENGLLGFSLSAHHTLIKNPYLTVFYLNKTIAGEHKLLFQLFTHPYDLVHTDEAFKSNAKHNYTDIIFTTQPQRSTFNALHTFIQQHAKLTDLIPHLEIKLANLPASIIAHFCTDALLQCPDTLELLPKDKIHEIYFLTHTLLTRAQGHQCGAPIPKTVLSLSIVQQQSLTFPRALPDTEVDVSDARIQPLLEQLNLRNYEQWLGLSMQSRMHQIILEKLTNYIPELNHRLMDCPSLRLIIYGAGSHTSILLRVWNALGGPSPDCIVVSTPPDTDSFEGLPLYCIDEIECENVDVIVISSASYEREIARSCEMQCPQSDIVCFWHEGLNKSNPQLSLQHN